MTFTTESKHTTKMETNRVMKKKTTLITDMTNTTQTVIKQAQKNEMIFISVMTYLMHEEINLGIIDIMTFIKNGNTQKAHTNWHIKFVNT